MHRRFGQDQRAALVLVDMLGYPVADTAEILGMLGLDRAAIDGLARDGVIGLAGDIP